MQSAPDMRIMGLYAQESEKVGQTLDVRAPRAPASAWQPAALAGGRYNAAFAVEPR
jgi:hypothetical protein